MDPAVSPTVRRLELAALLRQARHETGQTLAAVARKLRYSAPTISRFESGERLPREQDIRMLCRLYGMSDDAQVEHLVELLHQAEDTGWWEAFDVGQQYQKFIGLEASATSIQIVESLRVPALAMTPEYAEATWAIWQMPAEDVYSRRKILPIRQRILERSDPPHVQLVLDEAMLWRAVGGREVMAGQVAKLRTMVSRPHVELRIIPFEQGAHYGLHGTFQLLRLPVDAVEDTVYVDGLIGQFFFDSPKQLARYENYFTSLWESSSESESTTASLLTEAARRWSSPASGYAGSSS